VNVELRELRAFVAVVEEGSLSAAARRLHVSQPALSQTVNGLERRLGLQLLVRASTGVRPTDAGRTLLAESRAVLARHDQAVAALARHSAPAGSALRVGIPLELPSGLLGPPLAALAAESPSTTVQALHMSTSAQVAALGAGELDLGLVREHPAGQVLDALLVAEERLGVLLGHDIGAALTASGDATGSDGAGGVRLDALAGLDWVGFPRSGSPAWYDEIVAILRSHGLDPGPAAPEGQELIPDVKLAAVSAGGAFALAPPDWSAPFAGTVSWHPLIGHPIVRRTWAVWPAGSHRRDLGVFVAAFAAP
jgi:DNA-binding transcriptional LysR family regulator